MWGHYGPKGMTVEKDELSSVQVSPNNNDMSRPYVLHDITTYFTILVGIYFPSVTGNVFYVCMWLLTLMQTHMLLFFNGS